MELYEVPLGSGWETSLDMTTNMKTGVLLQLRMLCARSLPARPRLARMVEAPNGSEIELNRVLLPLGPNRGLKPFYLLNAFSAFSFCLHPFPMVCKPSFPRRSTACLTRRTS